jgi:carbonic anhydrase
VHKLVQGVHNFQANVFSRNRDLFIRLTAGQSPQALFITCSDSRIVPDLITQSDPGDLFVLRNAGNIVPPYGTGSGAEAAAIEYAVKGLGVKDVVVCGHTRCGAMRGVLHPGDVDALPRVRDWLRHADAGREIVLGMYGHLDDDARWQALVEENVLSQVENLRTHPAVAVGLATGVLKLHAWVYKMETGEVCSHDPASGRYHPLAPTAGSALPSPFRYGPLGRTTDPAVAAG